MSGPSDPHDPAAPPRRPRRWPWGLCVFVVACGVFGYHLADEPHFADESAYVAQSYFADLFFEGRRDDPAWLAYAAIDLPPGAKYLVGLALRAGGFPRGSPTAAVAWYDNTSRRFETRASLVTARMPMVVVGALGCVAVSAIGTLAFGRPAGLIAAALLMASPLYFMHSRRAMSDVPAEAMGLVALAIGLAAWSRWLDAKRGRWTTAFALTLLAGVFVGLAVLCKLSGTLAGMILGAWAFLGLFSKGTAVARKLGLVVATCLAGMLAVATFTALNPTLTAHPPEPMPPGMERAAGMSFEERAKLVKDHRVEVSAIGQRRFADDALITPVDKVLAVIVQGFGRFSPLGPRHSDSTVRYDWRQDWPAPFWLAIVAAGAFASYVRGRAQAQRGEPATAWAVLASFAVATAVVTSFLPLAWDRYYLAIQPWSVLLASAAVTAAAGRVRARVAPADPVSHEESAALPPSGAG